MQFTTRESRIYLQSWKSSVSYLSCAYSVLGLYLAHVWTGHINMMTDESYWCWCQSYYLMFQDAASVYTLESDMKSNILAWIDCQWKKQIWIGYGKSQSSENWKWSLWILEPSTRLNCIQPLFEASSASWQLIMCSMCCMSICGIFAGCIFL